MKSSTKCPNCGAPMQADKANGVFTCAHCGTLEEQPILVRDIEVGAPSDRLCPVCVTPLVHAHLDGNALLLLPTLFWDVDPDRKLRARHRGGTIARRSLRRVAPSPTESRRTRAGLSRMRATDAQSLLRRPRQPGHRHVRALLRELAGPGRAPSNRKGAARSRMDAAPAAREPGPWR